MGMKIDKLIRGPLKIARFDGIVWIAKSSQWDNLGIGLGIGMIIDILQDLIIWFNGVDIIWRLPSWVNFLEGVTPPEWWSKWMLSAENLFLILFSSCWHPSLESEI